MTFELCSFCKRFSRIEYQGQDKVCCECGRKLCRGCNVELLPMEDRFCSRCISSGEHTGDLNPAWLDSYEGM